MQTYNFIQFIVESLNQSFIFSSLDFHLVEVFLLHVERILRQCFAWAKYLHTTDTNSLMNSLGRIQVCSSVEDCFPWTIFDKKVARKEFHYLHTVQRKDTKYMAVYEAEK